MTPHGIRVPVRVGRLTGSAQFTTLLTGREGIVLKTPSNDGVLVEMARLGGADGTEEVTLHPDIWVFVTLATARRAEESR